eukprot:TRINITY_DN14363_c0_g2_i1.p1 TRINITY_DN14363_c0_g2~~TRINITY_DN14363_c0_g2_i1.p1  ORF type:complete len:256 (-),score=33.32 TRINITY_DN14363_c0_g2_i1:55-822(-)
MSSKSPPLASTMTLRSPKLSSVTNRSPKIASTPTRSPKLGASQDLPVDIEALRQAFPATFIEKDKTIVDTGKWQYNTRWNMMLWTEIFLKAAGQIVGYITLTTVTPTPRYSPLGIFETVIMCLIIIAYIPTVVSAIVRKELTGLTLNISAILSHIAVIGALLYGNTGISLVIFCSAMIVAEVFRLVYLDTLTTLQPLELLLAQDKSTAESRRLAARSQRFTYGWVIAMIILYFIVMVCEAVKLIELNSPGTTTMY